MKRELGLAAAVYAALAVLMTWPLVRDWQSAVPIGGDNLHLAWVLAWIAHALADDPLSLFEGNIFHPAAKTIALSDPNVSSALLVAPAWWSGAEAGALVNLLFLSSFVFCGLAAQALAREWGASALGAFAAGLFFAFSPHRFSHVDHVQLYAFWWTPLALLALDRFLRTGSGWALSAGALCLVLQSYASLYLAAFAAAATVLLFMTALVSGRARLDWRPALGKVALAAGLAALLCVPLAIAYAEVRFTWGATRSLEQNLRFSASPFAYLSAAPGNVVWGRVLERFADPVAPWEKHLFPGIVPILLAIVALVLDWKSWRVWYGFMLALVGFVCSLGPMLIWWGQRTGIALPYLVAWEWLPPLQGLRGPARWGLLVSLGLALVAGAGISRVPRAVAAAALAFAALEAWVYPLPTTPVPTVGPTRLDEWLARGVLGAVIELPLPPSGESQYERETARIYRSTFYWPRLVNGYSGYTPPPYGALREVLAVEPPERVLPVLAAWSVRTIVLHETEMTPAARAAWQPLVDRGELRRSFTDEGVVVLQHDFRPAPFRRLVARLANPPALQAGEWSAAKIAFEEGDPPVALPPAMLGWRRSRARWTAADGAILETRAKYFCPPIVSRELAWRTVYLVAPEIAGTYRVRIEGDCFELEESVEVAGPPLK